MTEPTDHTNEPVARSEKDSGRNRSLGVQILVGMAIGVIVGLLFGERAQALQPVGDLFIRLLLMTAIPLVFFNLLAGITSLTDVRLLGRLGGRILAYYITTTVLALVMGIVAMQLLHPGRGMELTESVTGEFGRVPRVWDVILDLVPNNVFQAFASGQVAQVVVFAVLLGVATLTLPDEHRRVLRRGFGILADLFRRLVGYILYVGPVGLGALAASTVGGYGSRIFGPLALFLVGVWSAQLAMVIVYMVLLTLFTTYTPWRFLKLTGPLYATTAATTSSLASLVVSLDIAERRLRLPRSVYSFTLPLGAQLNKDGTAIMLAGVLLFTAQAAGVDFPLSSLLAIILVGLILSEGSGGIPGGGLVIAFIFVEAFQLPVEIAAIVGGIYRLIDMGSTTINCMGDLVGTVIVAEAEGSVRENQ